MNPLKRAVRSCVYLLPGAQAFWIHLNQVFGPRAEFSGWGMQTDAYPPWSAAGNDELSREFLAAHDELVARVKTGEVVLTQFADAQDIERTLRELMWRHFVVFWSVRRAAAGTAAPVKQLAECGVCDGLSSHFAMAALRGRVPFQSLLYDAWDAMRPEQLLESEQRSAGAYGYLSVENTQRNLASFAPNATFVKGFIPDVFGDAPGPAELVWLHIDLNASKPTTAALEHFFGRMPPGAMILLDDYAWRGFEDTRAAADRFFAGRPGMLLPMPTGQAMFFKL